jgi:hypothetical protein
MSYQIAQDFEYAGNDYWRWWAWIDAEQTELDEVKEVVWILHPSFKQSRVIATDRANNFRLQTAGWGTFLLRAEVVLRDGEKRLLRRNLRLEYPESTPARPRSGPTEAAAPERPLIVFLSYSTEDSRAAAKVREGLTKAGLDVLDQTRIDAGEVWSDALKRMISQADAVVGLVGEDEISPWVSAEIKAAVASEKPAFALLAPGSFSAGIPKGARTLEVDVNRLDPSSIAELIRSQKAE